MTYNVFDGPLNLTLSLVQPIGPS